MCPRYIYKYIYFFLSIRQKTVNNKFVVPEKPIGWYYSSIYLEVISEVRGLKIIKTGATGDYTREKDPCRPGRSLRPNNYAHRPPIRFVCFYQFSGTSPYTVIRIYKETRARASSTPAPSVRIFVRCFLFLPIVC